MTHIPVGKRLPVTEYVPLPQPRPEIPPSTESTMPLGSTEKPAGAFLEGPSYHPTWEHAEGKNIPVELHHAFPWILMVLVGLLTLPAFVRIGYVVGSYCFNHLRDYYRRIRSFLFVR